MSIKVAVRVRPFNERESKGGSTCCVRMAGPTTTIFDPATGKEKPYTFDYSFWSHDGYKEVDGYSVADGPDSNYADQTLVYDALGKQVLENAWAGYHCCLFAYGQTGAGKSYSMVGYGQNRGIVPISCDEIFKRIEENKNPNIKYQVQFSMLEIYNEKVQDLLTTTKVTGGLKVRESQSGAVYVQGLTKHPVDSYAMISKKMDEGFDSRSIGSTLMNQTSSRAHTVMTIEFKQIIEEEGRKIEKFSVINLVDLAGSEKAGQTGAEGQRLKEGCAINKSLTVLGTCISVLADKAMGKEKKAIVPYRDSNLTRILQNALGGNSKTIMICAISPADMNFEESLGTLRYADRAKKIQNKAVVNESATDKLIRELKTENERLKELLMKAAKGGGQINIEELGLGSANDIIESMDHTQQQLEEMESDNFDAKLKEQKKLDEEKQKAREEQEKRENKRAPHLVNLNEDPQLSQHIYYSMAEFPVLVGRKNDKPLPSIMFQAISVKANHGQCVMLENGLIEFQITNPEAYEHTAINGKKLPKGEMKQVLNHLDTIYFDSQSALILFKYPLQNRKVKELRKAVVEETEGQDLGDEEISVLVQSRLLEQGVTTDLSKVVCEDYTDEEIKHDYEAVDWDKAFDEINKMEEQKRQLYLQMIQEQERQKYQEEMEKHQEEVKAKNAQMEMELAAKQAQLEKEQKEKEEKLRQQEVEAQQRLEQQLKEKEQLLQRTMSMQAQSTEAKQKQQQQEEIEEIKKLQQQEARQREYEMEKLQIERDMAMKQMQQEKDRYERAIQEQKKQFESKLKNDQQIEEVRHKIKDITKDVEEANSIAEFMNKDIKFTSIIVSKFDEQSVYTSQSAVNNDKLAQQQTDVQIKVENFESGQIHIWTSEKFKDKLIMMRDALQTYEDKEFQELQPNEDPFYEKEEPMILGQAFYLLEGLQYLMDDARTIPIVSITNEIFGMIDVNVVPCDEDGNELSLDDLDDDIEPEHLLNQTLDFKVKIDRITKLPENFCTNIFCEYKFYMDDTKYTTEVHEGRQQNPEINYERHHHVDCVTKFLLDYLKEETLTIKIYGNQDLKKGKKKGNANDTTMTSASSTNTSRTTQHYKK